MVAGAAGLTQAVAVAPAVAIVFGARVTGIHLLFAGLIGTLTLLTLAALALIPATIMRQAKPEWGYLPLLAPVLLAALGFGLDYAVQTDSEKIHAIIRQCRQAAIEEDLWKAEACL